MALLTLSQGNLFRTFFIYKTWPMAPTTPQAGRWIESTGCFPAVPKAWAEAKAQSRVGIPGRVFLAPRQQGAVSHPGRMT